MRSLHNVLLWRREVGPRCESSESTQAAIPGEYATLDRPRARAGYLLARSAIAGVMICADLRSCSAVKRL